jgi:hypothetical protein
MVIARWRSTTTLAEYYNAGGVPQQQTEAHSSAGQEQA